MAGRSEQASMLSNFDPLATAACFATPVAARQVGFKVAHFDPLSGQFAAVDETRRHAA